jgi:hypothetical protein
MFQSVTPSSVGAGSAQGLLAPSAASRDDESRLAATLRTTHGGADDAKRRPRKTAGDAARAALPKAAPAEARTAAVEMIRAIEARLPGRIRDLKVDLDKDQFVLRGVSCSYYVKQVAGHLAMTAMDAHLLGRLLNEIEVRSAR